MGRVCGQEYVDGSHVGWLLLEGKDEDLQNSLFFLGCLISKTLSYHERVLIVILKPLCKLSLHTYAKLSHSRVIGPWRTMCVTCILVCASLVERVSELSLLKCQLIFTWLSDIEPSNGCNFGAVTGCFEFLFKCRS